jgi:hypothetical protein
MIEPAEQSAAFEQINPSREPPAQRIAGFVVPPCSIPHVDPKQ